jgi:UMF1 family MFS transporter
MATDRQRLVAWWFYDWGNSAFTTLVVTFIYSTYFSQALAGTPETGTVLWSRAMGASALLIAITSPLLGALADRGGNRRRSLRLASFLCIILTAALTFVSPGQPQALLLALLLFVGANTAYEIAIVFYNAYLPEFASADRSGRISGYGWGLGYVGGILCLAMALVLLVGSEPLLALPREAGLHVRATNLLTALWFLLFTLPFLLLAPPDRLQGKPATVATAVADLADTFRSLRRFRQVSRFLLAHLIYNDGLVTIFAFGGIYAAGTFGMTIPEVVLFGIALNIAAGIGAFLFGHLEDAIGGKPTILLTLAGLTLATLTAALAPDRFWFWLAGLFVGLFVGPNQSASRALMGRLTPAPHRAQFYGFYTLSGKVTAFLGPLLLGSATAFFQSQRAGIATIIPFFLIGGLLLLAVSETPAIADQKDETFAGSD